MTRLNPADFPGSPYAGELRRGGVRLPFGEPLEAQFRVAHLLRVRLRVRIWLLLGAVLSVLFTIQFVWRRGFVNPWSLAHVTLLVPCALTLVWLSWSRGYQRMYLPAARLLVPLFTALIAVFIARALTDGHSEQLAALAVNLIAIFFFAGLMFGQALWGAAVVLLAFAATAVAVELPLALLTGSLVVLSLSTAIGAILYRDAEKSHRIRFLENALMDELVIRDALSGLLNRRAFDEHLLRVWQHALRDQRSIAILMIDIDHFKHYNDAFGHQAGDAALRSVAQTAQGFARRPLDLAARYGGEEFAVILYDLAPVHVLDMAERLCLAVNGTLMQPDDSDASTPSRLTVSVGVGVVAPSIGRTPQGAVQLADEALYEAKQAGRNRVVIKGADAYRLLTTGSFKSPQGARAGL